MQLVDPHSIWSMRSLGVRSYSLGLGVMVGIFLLYFAITSIAAMVVKSLDTVLLAMLIAFLAVTLFVAPIAGLIRWRIQLESRSRRMCAILWSSLGFLSLPYVAVFTVATKSGRSPIAYGLIACVAMHLAYLIFWTAINLIVWPIVVETWPFRIQDGQSCPQCGYCVRGASSQICPECGRKFEHDDLGISRAEFVRLISGEAQSGQYSKPG